MRRRAEDTECRIAGDIDIAGQVSSACQGAFTGSGGLDADNADFIGRFDFIQHLADQLTVFGNSRFEQHVVDSVNLFEILRTAGDVGLRVAGNIGKYVFAGQYEIGDAGDY